MSRQLLVVADSRGEKLSRYLNANFPSWITYPFVLPGGTIPTLHHLLKQKLPFLEKENLHVVVAGGICNLTQKTKHQGGIQITYNGNTRSRVSDLLYALHTLVTDINQNFNLPVHVVCIPPANLIKYSDEASRTGKLTSSLLTPAELAFQQKLLETDIAQINNEILQINQQQGLAPIRWDKSLQKIKIQKRGSNGENTNKKTLFCYNHLYDGVHPNTELSNIWFSYMCRSILESN